MVTRRTERLPAERGIVALGVLGPIEAWDALGRSVRITHGQQRVLALLLESANEIVRDDVLLDKLWPDGRTRESVKILQTNVWSLKKLIKQDGESSAPMLRRRGEGYELRVDGAQFDWFRYQRLRTAAARAIAAGRPAEAKGYLLDARRLWRGDALMGLATDLWTLPFAQQLEAARADVELHLVEVGLELGEHHELIPALRHLTGKTPQDESLARLLMLALYRSGRQADALEAYDACRRALAESGLVPAPQLSATEVEILMHAPAALTPAPGARRGTVESRMSGTLLVARWAQATPPPWARGDSELALCAEDEGAELLEAGGASLVARFDDVDRALATAVAIQTELKRREGPLGRFVVHDGSRAATRGARLRQLCERLLAEADAGQVLVFRSAQDPDARRPGLGRELRELGEHHVHGIDPAVHLFQLMAPDLTDAAPPFTLLAPPPAHNLPRFANRFLGRDTLVEDVALALSHHRLVTLTGPGGGGKTRLATETARSLVGEYRDGAWFVDLEWLTDRELLAGTVADAVGVDRSRNLPIADVLLRELSNRHMLLVLDTCEHLVGAVRSLVDRLLGACPGVSVLATSLQPLDSEHEDAIAVPPLAPPVPGASVDRLRENPAVQLFSEHLGTLTMTDADLGLVAEACRLVDGIPLTIALAAARARQLGLTALVAELRRTLGSGGALRLLDAGGRLHETLEWSFSLLGDGERRVLRSLSLFAGAFSLHEARDYLAGSSDDDVASTLCTLASCSAVVVEGDDAGAPLYRLLQPVRAFAASKLDDDPSEKARLGRSHAELYLRRAQAADSAFGGADEQRHLVGLDACANNLRAALAWAISAEQTEIALGLAGALWRYWFSRGQLTEGLKLCLDALALERAPTAAGIRVLGGSSYLAWWTGDLKYTLSSAEETASLAEAVDDPWGRAWAPLGLAAVSMFRPGEATPAADLRPAVAYFVDAGLRWEAGQALQLLAGQEWYRGNHAAACEHFTRAVELSRAAGSQTFMDSRQGRGLMLGLLGEVEEGVREIQAGLELADRRGDPVGICHALTYRAAIATYEHDFDEAARLYSLALRVANDTGEIWIVQWALDGLAAWAARRGGEVAARLLGRVESLSKATGIRLAPAERAAHAAAVAQVRASLDAAAFARGFSEGQEMGIASAVELALGLGA